MLFYYLIFIVFFFLGFLDIENAKTTVKKTIYFLCILFLILISGFRWKTGTDWDMYYYYFTNYFSFEQFNNGSFEFLYACYVFLIKSFTESYSVFLMISAFIIIGLKGYMFKKMESYFMICLLAYYSLYIGDIFSVRQNLAISISLFSIYFIVKKQKLFFLLSVIVATLIHNSAAVLFLAYPVFYMKLSNKVILILIAISLLIGFSGVLNPILGKFQFLIEGLGGADSDRISGKLDTYTTESQTTKIDSNLSLLISALRRLIILPVILYFRKDIRSKTFDGYINLFTFSNIIFFTISNISIVFGRFLAYFIIIEILIIANLLRAQKDKRKRFLWYIFFSFYFVFRLYVSLNAYPDLYDPYYWIFDKYIPRIPY